MPHDLQNSEWQPPAGASTPLVTRGYQAEMLHQSLARNTIIALETGSGKTHIAVLRLKHEMEKDATKLSWFIAPTVSLCEQQHGVLKKYLSLSIGLVSGENEPDQWKNAALWHNFIRTHQIVVSTPQVLLDALRHGYIVMGRDIRLIVFDEAHHTRDNHPYNKIMQEFYFRLPPCQADSNGTVRPMILGLTASPVYAGNVQKDLRTIEKNLDSVVCTPSQHQYELSQYVHRPTFRCEMYSLPKDPFSTNLASLQAVERGLNIEQDPFVIDLRSKLSKSTPGSAEYHKLDQRLSKVIDKKDSFTHKGLRDFVNAASGICSDLGEWAADWFVFTVIQQAKQAASPYNNFMASWRQSEKAYLLQALDMVVVTPVSYHADDIDEGCTDKVNVLIEILLSEMAEGYSLNEVYSGLIFVERRDTVLTLAEVLKHHPRLKDVPFRIGTLLGTSNTTQRHSVMDITRHLVGESQGDTLESFRDGTLNLIVSTAVAEEGIDIQACGSVIRWDPPQNMKSWIQSRGRARKKRSTFTMMYKEGTNQQNSMMKWLEEEKQMLNSICAQSGKAEFVVENSDDPVEYDGDELMFEVPATGAKLTVHSAISHLTHFCAKIPNSTHADNRPLFERDPPEFPDGWHSSLTPVLAAYQGPYGATVTLPRALPLLQRQFSVERKFKTVVSAYRHAAFAAYKELYEHHLLNENLLPIENVDPKLDAEVDAMLNNVEARDGLADLTSLGIDPWLENGESTIWQSAVLTIEGLPPLFLFTKSDIVPLAFDQGPVIYRPEGPPRRISLNCLGEIPTDSVKLVQARDFTRRIFWGINAARMEWDNLDFAYLFLPVHESNTIWDSRRAWLEEEHTANPGLYPDRLMVKSDRFAKKFGYAEDLTLIQRHVEFGRPWKFTRWSYDALRQEEEEKLRQRYGKFFDKTAIEYPLMVVEPCAPRTNMLLPNCGNAKKNTDHDVVTQYLIPEHSRIILLSQEEAEYAFLLPSVLRALTALMMASSLRKSLFLWSPLQDIPLPLLTAAITAPSSNDGVNYQRLETLGDAFLKFVVSVQLHAEYPFWHEGYLTPKKSRAVSNVRLAKEDLKRGLYRWLIRDAMLGRKWKPKYFSSANNSHPSVDDLQTSSVEVRPILVSSPANENNVERPPNAPKRKKKSKVSPQLSTKVLADVVESIIGAAYFCGGVSLGNECVKYFGLGLEWKPISTRIDQILARSDDLATSADTFTVQVEDVEHMLDYTFHRKSLLIEALTHASYQGSNNQMPSYERMECLGDSVLDLIVNSYLYRVPGKKYSPGHVYFRKITVVNMHFLAYICLNTSTTKAATMPMRNVETGKIEESHEEHEISLFKCLLHSSVPVLEDQAGVYSRYKRMKNEIGHALREGDTYPWAALTRLQAPKFFSDMIESLIGAVYIDSRGDMGTVEGVLRNLGIMQVLEHLVQDDVDVMHPISRLTFWMQKTGQKLDFKLEQKEREVVCRVFVGDEELECARATAVFRGKVSQEEVKFSAAEAAIKELKLRDVGVRYDVLKQRKTKGKE